MKMHRSFFMQDIMSVFCIFYAAKEHTISQKNW